MASDLNNLAGLYRDQSKYDQAEPLYKRALAIREKVLDANHPDLAISLEEYAAMLKAAKRDAEAEPLLKRAKEIREKQQR